MVHVVYSIGSCVRAECVRSKVLRTVSNGGWTPQHQHTATTLHLLTTAFSGLPGPLTPEPAYPGHFNQSGDCANCANVVFINFENDCRGIVRNAGDLLLIGLQAQYKAR